MTSQDPPPRGEVWDPFGTLRGALWIRGGQWAGKSTIARILAARYGLTAYHYDYHDARAHHDRRIARRIRLGQPPEDLIPTRSGCTPPAADGCRNPQGLPGPVRMGPG